MPKLLSISEIDARREQLGLTVLTLCKDAGINHSSYYKLTNNPKIKPRSSTIAKLEAALRQHTNSNAIEMDEEAADTIMVRRTERCEYLVLSKTLSFDEELADKLAIVVNRDAREKQTSVYGIASIGVTFMGGEGWTISVNYWTCSTPGEICQPQDILDCTEIGGSPAHWQTDLTAAQDRLLELMTLHGRELVPVVGYRVGTAKFTSLETRQPIENVLAWRSLGPITSFLDDKALWRAPEAAE